MIPFPSGTRVWLATGHTDMRRGMNSLALQVQEVLKRDPYDGQVFVFRGKRGDLIKILWSDGQGVCLFAKRLERGRFIWPSPADGVVTISAGQLGYLLEGIDWRMPQTNLATGAGRLINRESVLRSSFDFKNSLECACMGRDQRACHPSRPISPPRMR